MSGRRSRSPNTARLLAGSSALLVIAACLESSIVQVGLEDVTELRLTPDSANVAIGRTLQAQALTLDGAGSLLVGLEVGWSSDASTVATVDQNGLISGVATGTARIVASAAGFSDTAIVVVAPAPALVLSDTSVAFAGQVGQPSPPPDTVQITNGGAFPLVGVAIDSIVYTGSATGWLTAQLAATAAPTEVQLTVTTTGITTAGVYTAKVWVSATDADGSPRRVNVVLNLAAGAPATIGLNAGDTQTAQVGTAVGTSPSVLVRDASNNPVPGAVVTFGVTGGGGSVTGSPATTDASGIARVGSWTLGGMAGPNALDATLASVGTVSFTATGVPGPATKLQIVDGDGQAAVAGSAVSTSPSVAALDAFDNGVEGVDVAFSVATGGGDITNATQTTDAAGIATAGTWTLGATAGPNTVRAVAASIPDSVTFSATGLPGGIDEILLVDGDAQIDTVAATLTTLYAVKVEDVNDNGIPGITVSWQVTGGGGTITATSDTDAGGVAVATRVLGNTPGTHTARALFGGAPDTVTFSATANVGTPAKLVAVAGTGQSATVNTNVATPPKVQVTDKFDNPIEGHSVSFAVKGVAATISPAGAMLTLADGTATLTSWKLGTVAASLSDTVEVTPAGGAVVPNLLRITATANAGPAASIAIVSGNNQTALTGANVASPPMVVVRDQYANPVPNVRVNFSPDAGSSVGAAADTTGATGQAFTTWNVTVSSATMQSNGTFPHTLTATVNGTAISAAFTGSAIYSYATNVLPVFNSSCNGCHGGFITRANLYNQAAACSPSTLRISPVGGITAEQQSLVTIYVMGLANPSGCTGHGGGTFVDPTLQTIRAWIRNGAPNN